MKIRVALIMLSYLVPLLCAGQAGRSHALVVLVGDYPPGSGWGPLHSVGDLELIDPLLDRQGCETRTVLKDGQATKAAIVGALAGLSDRVGAGDRVYIHFSCHGQQMVDDDGDEPDGLDEAIVPYDARRRFTPGVYEGENHLRDDELGRWLDRVRLRAGERGDVTLVADACHSGTVDRAADGDYVRGTTYIFGSESQIAPPADPSRVRFTAADGPGMARLTVYAACGPGESNFEYRVPGTDTYYGSLTYALHRVVTDPACQGLTPSGLNERVASVMREMFAGRRRTQTPNFETTDDKKISPFCPR